MFNKKVVTILVVFMNLAIPQQGKAKDKKVLKLESGVIEGIVKLPKIFLEFDAYSPTLDSIIFKRENFNEYHKVEMTKRPYYQTYKRLGEDIESKK